MPPAAAASPPLSAIALMAGETRVREGAVPRSVGGADLGDLGWVLHDGEFVLRAPGGIGLRYARGEGITLERRTDSDPREIALLLNGTLYAAVAALNGLVPLHASAVAHQGRVHAFTGPAGAGKSTLVAALGRAGFAQFCDDTLILDPAGEGPPLALPGHKRLKLWPEGARLAEVDTGELVTSDYPKRYARPAAGVVDTPLPLAELLVLDTGDAPRFATLGGGERIAALDDDHYTGDLWRLAGPGREARFTMLAALARRFVVTRFSRPFDPARFADGIAAASAHIRSFRR